MVCAAWRKDFRSSSVKQPLGLCFGFGCTSVFGSPTGVCFLASQEGAKGSNWGEYWPVSHHFATHIFFLPSSLLFLKDFNYTDVKHLVFSHISVNYHLKKNFFFQNGYILLFLVRFFFCHLHLNIKFLLYFPILDFVFYSSFIVYISLPKFIFPITVCLFSFISVTIVI